MQRQPVITKDGSHTIEIPEMNVTYHSIHGAIQESQHIFIRMGLEYLINQSPDQPVNIFEMGFGTGLNALLTYIESEKYQRKIDYTTVELYPLFEPEYLSLNYCDQLQRNDLKLVFNKLHQSKWETAININDHFHFKKENKSLINYSTKQLFNMIYYDAFAPAAQPELWTKEIFEKLYSMLSRTGVLVTYCSKGNVRRAMQAAGFIVDKIPGPPGKREMLRAISK